MAWSIQVARAFGIPIRVHLTFLLIVGWGALSWGTRHGLHGAMFGVLSTLLLFASVALHELGHSVVAQRRGLRVLEILLLPIGGVAALDGKPSRPRDELWIALAGPAVNFVIALALGALAAGLHHFGLFDLGQVRAMLPSWSTLLGLLILGNLTLGLFNLLPIFPMDGGRVLRALLASRYGMERGTRWAAGFGQFAAVGLGTYAVLSGAFILALIAGLVFLAAGRERLEARARGALAGFRAGDVCQVPSLLLEPGERVSHALSRTLKSSEHVFPVVLGSTMVGVVDRAELLFAVRAGRGDEFLASIQRREWPEVDVSTPVEAVLEALDRSRAAVAVVLDGDVPVGLVTREHVFATVVPFAALQSATRGGPRREQPEAPR